MRKPALLLFLLLAPAIGAFAQSTYSAIQGTISDDQGGVLPGVTVTIANTATGLMRTAVTNERGSYRVPNLPPGPYTVKAELAAFAPQERQNVALAMGSEISIDLRLGVAALQESITVSGQTPLVETTQKSIETT